MSFSCDLFSRIFLLPPVAPFLTHPIFNHRFLISETTTPSLADFFLVAQPGLRVPVVAQLPAATPFQVY